MRFAYLGSGSKGNGAVISHGDTHLLLDCGFAAREAESRLQRLGLSADMLNAIIVTHEHGDHVRGVDVLARRHDLPVFLTRGTREASRLDARVRCTDICLHSAFEVGGIVVQPYPVPHDAREPCQFTFSAGDLRLGVLSDVGHITPHIVEQLSQCDALAVEFNHDSRMLAEGPYPLSLKQRVGGMLGHLNNEQAAGLLRALPVERIRHLVIAHISEKNNCPDLARRTAAEALGRDPEWVKLASQTDGTDWFQLTPQSTS